MSSSDEESDWHDVEWEDWVPGTLKLDPEDCCYYFGMEGLSFAERQTLAMQWIEEAKKKISCNN
jgi:hypothetical protein